MLRIHRHASVAQSHHYRSHSRVSEPAVRLLCVHQLHSGNFHGIWIVALTQHVSHHRSNYPSRGFNRFDACRRQDVTQITLRDDVLRHDCRTLSFWNARISEELLRHARFRVGAYCGFVVCDFRRIDWIAAVDVRHAIGDSPTEGKQSIAVRNANCDSNVFTQQIRSFGATFCTAILWILSFLLLRYFATLVALLQLYVCMFIFCAFTFIGMIFVIFYVPETRNKSNEEIETALSR